MKITANEVELLNSKRTQGDWNFHEAPAQEFTDTLTGVGHYYEPYYAVECEGKAICDNGQYYPQNVRENDCRFIAAAPAMAELIAQQAGVIKIMREALKQALNEMEASTLSEGVYFGHNFEEGYDPIKVVEQALAAAPTLEGDL